jgi:hypothetical protein
MDRKGTYLHIEELPDGTTVRTREQVTTKGAEMTHTEDDISTSTGTHQVLRLEVDTWERFRDE